MSAYVVEGLSDGEWRELKQGTAVRRRFMCFHPPKSVACDCAVTQSAAEPIIRNLLVYYVEGVSAGTTRQ